MRRPNPLCAWSSAFLGHSSTCVSSPAWAALGGLPGRVYGGPGLGGARPCARRVWGAGGRAGGRGWKDGVIIGGIIVIIIFIFIIVISCSSSSSRIVVIVVTIIFLVIVYA